MLRTLTLALALLCLVTIAFSQPALTYLNHLNQRTSSTETYVGNVVAGPLLNRAGNRMVFSQEGRHTYFATKNKDGVWETPIEIPGHVGICGFEGTRLYLASGGAGGVIYSELHADGFWSKPVVLFRYSEQFGEVQLSPNWFNESVTITPDGGIVVYSTKSDPANPKIPQKAYRLYYAKRNAQSPVWNYQKSQNIMDKYSGVNQVRPILLSDGKTLLYVAIVDKLVEGKVQKVEKQYVTRLLDNGDWSISQPTGGEKHFYTWASVNMDTAYFRTTNGRIGYEVDPAGVILKRPVIAGRTEPVVSPQVPTVVEPPAPASARYHALLIGVSDYADDKLDLTKPVEDLAVIKSVLSKRYTFDDKDIISLTNPDRQTILKTLYKLRTSIGPRDNLLIFYAGHGYWDKGIMQGYWLPSNASTSDPSNWLSNSDLREQIRGINSAHTLLISDACFSGGIFRTRGTENLQDAPLEIKMLYKMKSRRAITSGTLSSVPDESVFLQYLIQRLNENDESFLPSQSLFNSVRMAVINNSLTVPQDGVISEAGDEGGDFIFIRRK